MTRNTGRNPLRTLEWGARHNQEAGGTCPVVSDTTTTIRKPYYDDGRGGAADLQWLQTSFGGDECWSEICSRQRAEP